MIVDDNRDTLHTYSKALPRKLKQRYPVDIAPDLKIETETAETVAAALQKLNDRSFDLVIVDLKIPGLNGEEMGGLRLIDELVKIDPSAPVVAVTGHGSVELAKKTLKKQGVFDFIEKSANAIDELADAAFHAVGFPRKETGFRGNGGSAYIASLELENIRCFDTLCLQFEQDEEPVLWTMILGDNATGKTTLLRSIALGLCPESDATALMKELPYSLIKDGKDKARIRIVLKRQDTGAVYGITTEIIRKSPDTPDIVRQTTEPEERFPWRDIFVCGYGPHRASVADASYDRYDPKAALELLFNYEATLQNPEIILLRQDPETRKALEKKVLKIMMLDDSDNAIGYRGKKGLEISGRWGCLPFEGLSDGYRSTTQWILDFIGWSIFAGRFSVAGDIGGIVLIDEIEQHLHPKWQRHIVDRLKGQFPKVQFIATTHSPLIASGAGKLPGEKSHEKLVHLEALENASIEAAEIDTLAGLGIDQILASRAFDYLVDDDPRVESLLAEASKLAGKGDSRDDEENRRYLEISSRP